MAKHANRIEARHGKPHAFHQRDVTPKRIRNHLRAHMQPPGSIHKCQQIAGNQAFLRRGKVKPDLFRQMITQRSFRRFHGFNAREIIIEIAVATTANRRQAIVVNIIPFGIEWCGIFRRQCIGSGGTGGIRRFACHR